MMHPIAKKLIPAAVLSLAFAQPAAAQEWTDWLSHTLSVPSSAQNGTASGLLDGIAVTYTGQVRPETQTLLPGTNYWNPPDPYISALTPNAPDSTDIIALQGLTSPGSLQTITFASAVWNPVLAIVSLGNNSATGIRFAFDQPFTILNSGCGFWSSSSCSGASLVHSSDPNEPNTLVGFEGHGIIMFSGSHTSITWDAYPTEVWSGFTVGFVPEPETYAMILAGLALLGFTARRRKQALRSFA